MSGEEQRTPLQTHINGCRQCQGAHGKGEMCSEGERLYRAVIESYQSGTETDCAGGEQMQEMSKSEAGASGSNPSLSSTLSGRGDTGFSGESARVQCPVPTQYQNEGVGPPSGAVGTEPGMTAAAGPPPPAPPPAAAPPFLIRLVPPEADPVYGERWGVKVVAADGTVLWHGEGWRSEGAAIEAGRAARAELEVGFLRSELGEIREGLTEAMASSQADRRELTRLRGLLGDAQEELAAARAEVQRLKDDRQSRGVELAALAKVARVQQGRADALAAELAAAYAVLDRGDETCASADLNPTLEARRAFGGLANLRDRLRDSVVGVIRTHEAEWSRLAPGMDRATWTAAVQMRDGYLSDVIRALSEAL